MHAGTLLAPTASPRAMRCSFFRRRAARPNERSSNMRHADGVAEIVLGSTAADRRIAHFLRSATACANPTIETEIPVANSVFNEPRSVIFEFLLDAMGVASAASSNGQSMKCGSIVPLTKGVADALSGNARIGSVLKVLQIH